MMPFWLIMDHSILWSIRFWRLLFSEFPSSSDFHCIQDMPRSAQCKALRWSFWWPWGSTLEATKKRHSSRWPPPGVINMSSSIPEETTSTVKFMRIGESSIYTCTYYILYIYTVYWYINISIQYTSVHSIYIVNLPRTACPMGLVPPAAHSRALEPCWSRVAKLQPSATRVLNWCRLPSRAAPGQLGLGWETKIKDRHRE